jgi:predicted TIM-barrel fold metal-dependent hydrolase/ketosteroid isomerase-like protein
MLPHPHLRRLAAGALLAICACAPGQRPASSPGAPSAPAVPLIDYHTHIRSLQVARLNATRPLPAVQLPAELDAFLRERARVWNDSAALARLYTDDALRLDDDEPNWIRGVGPVAGYVATRYARAYRIEPIAFSADGNVASISGYHVRGQGDSIRYFGDVQLALRRGADGAWRIASEAVHFGPPIPAAFTADQLISGMDDLGVRRSLVLSVAYRLASPYGPGFADEHARVSAENDWVAEQVARYPDRLVAFCSFNPLSSYALEEMDRCTRGGRMRGLKLHFGNSKVDLRNPEHLAKVKAVFRAANERRLPIVVHLWTTDPAYGPEHSRIFIEQVLPEAPDIPIQIAHLASGGGGPGYDAKDDATLAVFADAIAAHDPRTRNLWFDAATNVTEYTTPEMKQAMVGQMRRIGLDRILFGHDAEGTPHDEWLRMRSLPLTPAELRTIATNVAPYMR